MDDRIWLETLLNKNLNNKSIQTVLNVELNNAVPVGDNYLSEIQRATLSLIYGNGIKSKKTLIFKKTYNDESKAETLKDFPVFKAEIYVYEHVLEYFDQLMNDYQDYNDKLWCNLIGYKPNTLIVFEDLMAQNFRIPIRNKLLDLNHAKLVMHSLGRFHAMGYVVLQKGLLNKDDLILHYLQVESPVVVHLLSGGIQLLSHVMQRDWGPEWRATAVRLAKQENQVVEKVAELFKMKKDCFQTVNHGDCWTCNIMFKYCPYDDKLPIALKFVDFQNTHVNSYIFDIITFLYTSVQPDIRRSNFVHLLSLYQTALQSTLAVYGMEQRTPTLEHIKAEAKRVEYFAFAVCLTNMPLTCADIENPFIVENQNYDYHIANAYNPEVFNNKIFKDGVLEDLKYWMEQGVF